MCFSDSIQDEHILELSKRIPTGNELMDLGIKVLHLPECKINAALYDHNNSIQAATHELLSTWLKNQTNRPRSLHESVLRSTEGGNERIGRSA